MDELIEAGASWVDDVEWGAITPLLNGEGDPERVAEVERARDAFVQRKKNDYYSDGYVDSYIRVKVKEGVDNRYANAAAALLSSLNNFFDYEASYDG